MALHRVRGVLGVLRRDAVGVLNRAMLMEKGLEDHAETFSDPRPTLPVFSEQIAATQAAQLAVQKGGKGTTAARDVEIGLLLGMMTSELVYVQSICDTQSPDQAVATLQMAGVVMAEASGHGKDILTVRPGPKPRSVVLAANARALLGEHRWRKHFFCWEHTLDGTTFIAAPSTPEATTTVTDLPTMTTVGFRVAVSTTGGFTSPWSQVVELLVIR
jgi:hypothetical protein